MCMCVRVCVRASVCILCVCVREREKRKERESERVCVLVLVCVCVLCVIMCAPHCEQRYICKLHFGERIAAIGYCASIHHIEHALMFWPPTYIKAVFCTSSCTYAGQHTSADVSIQQHTLVHTSADFSTRQQTFRTNSCACPSCCPCFQKLSGTLCFSCAPYVRSVSAACQPYVW